MAVPANIADIVRDAAGDLAGWVQQVREDIHAHPELRYGERRTAELCATQREPDGLEVRRGGGRETGLTGHDRGRGA